MSDGIETEAPTKAGRLLFLDETTARATVRDGDLAAQHALRAEILEAIARHELPVEQTMAVLWSLHAVIGSIYSERFMETEETK